MLPALHMERRSEDANSGNISFSNLRTLPSTGSKNPPCCSVGLVTFQPTQESTDTLTAACGPCNLNIAVDRGRQRFTANHQEWWSRTRDLIKESPSRDIARGGVSSIGRMELGSSTAQVPFVDARITAIVEGFRMDSIVGVGGILVDPCQIAKSSATVIRISSWSKRFLRRDFNRSKYRRLSS